MALVIWLLAGCGTTHPKTPEATVRAFHVALVRGDGEAACDYLGPSFRRSFLRLGTLRADSCEALVRAFGRITPTGSVEQVSKERLTATVTGNRARVQAVAAPGGDEWMLDRTGGRWRIVRVLPR